MYCILNHARAKSSANGFRSYSFSSILENMAQIDYKQRIILSYMLYSPDQRVHINSESHNVILNVIRFVYHMK